MEVLKRCSIHQTGEKIYESEGEIILAFYLKDKYVWDFWLIQKSHDYHLFYLQAERTPHNPDLRHATASVGHAVSKDLIQWKVLPDALLAAQCHELAEAPAHGPDLRQGGGQ